MKTVRIKYNPENLEPKLKQEYDAWQYHRELQATRPEMDILAMTHRIRMGNYIRAALKKVSKILRGWGMRDNRQNIAITQ
jgi:hypothetical protein